MTQVLAKNMRARGDCWAREGSLARSARHRGDEEQGRWDFHYGGGRQRVSEGYLKAVKMG